MYSKHGPPATLVQVWLDAFHGVMETREILAGLDATGVARLEIWASIPHDPEHGWPVTSSAVSSQRVRKRRNDVVVDVTCETLALRSAGL